MQQEGRIATSPAMVCCRRQRDGAKICELDLPGGLADHFGARPCRFHVVQDISTSRRKAPIRTGPRSSVSGGRIPDSGHCTQAAQPNSSATIQNIVRSTENDANPPRMDPLTLFGTAEELTSVRAKKVRAVASLAQIPIQQQTCTLDDLERRSPFSKGLVLTHGESSVSFCQTMMKLIVRLNPSSNLLGSTPLQQGLIEGWMDFSWHSLELPLNTMKQGGPTTSPSIAPRLVQSLQVLDKHLGQAKATYLVGNALSLADVCIAVVLQSSLGHLPLATVPNVSSWLSVMERDLVARG